MLLGLSFFPQPLRIDQQLFRRLMMVKLQTAILVTVSLAIGGLAGAGLTWHRMVEKRRLSFVMNLSISALATNEDLDRIDSEDIKDIKANIEASLAAKAISLDVFSKQQDLAGDFARQTLARLAPKRARPSIVLLESKFRKTIELATTGQRNK